MIAGAFLVAIGWGMSDWATIPLPPTDFVYYQDLFYHLSLVHEMTRTMPFEVPQLAGDTLRYHYLSDAHMAAASMITGVSPVTVLLRLFAVPIVGVAIIAFAALAREITGRWWAGPLAGAVAICGQTFIGSPILVNGSSAIAYASPSQTYAMPLLALLLAIAVDALRGRTSGRSGSWYRCSASSAPVRNRVCCLRCSLVLSWPESSPGGGTAGCRGGWSG